MPATAEQTVLRPGKPPVYASHMPWEYERYQDFPVKISRYEYSANSLMFTGHWHEQLQILYCEQGEAEIYCNANIYRLSAGNILIINSNEIHYGIAHNGRLVYHMIKPEFSFLASHQADLCQLKYILPLQQESIRFQNHIIRDEVLAADLKTLISEYTVRDIGYELAVKSLLYKILVHLLRHYQQHALPAALLERQQKTLHQLREALLYMEERYTEDIPLSTLAELAHMSSQHFCVLFKKLTGKRPRDYINYLRVNKASVLLAEQRLNISEVAMAVGFSDSNYFSRVFKRYRQIPPSALLKTQDIVLT